LAEKSKRPSLKFLLATRRTFLHSAAAAALPRGRPAPSAPCSLGSPSRSSNPHFTDFGLLLALTAAYLLGIWLIDVTGKAIGDPDHGSIVWDEIVPFWLVLLLTPNTFLWQLSRLRPLPLFRHHQAAARPLFRQHVKNGFGVMADDLVAAGYTLLCLAC
jgi:phosphatidylglycerophosphatase A